LNHPTRESTKLGAVPVVIFEACASDITDIGEEHGHRVLRVVGKGTKVALVLLPSAVRSLLDHMVGR